MAPSLTFMAALSFPLGRLSLPRQRRARRSSLSLRRFNGASVTRLVCFVLSPNLTQLMKTSCFLVIATTDYSYMDNSNPSSAIIQNERRIITKAIFFFMPVLLKLMSVSDCQRQSNPFRRASQIHALRQDLDHLTYFFCIHFFLCETC